MQYWLVKTEPESYSWADFVKDGKTAWTGVRNFQARNNLRAMKKGDLVLFYHSVSEKQAVGLARVDREPFPDPTATDGDWWAVDLAPVKPLPNPSLWKPSRPTKSSKRCRSSATRASPSRPSPRPNSRG